MREVARWPDHDRRDLFRSAAQSMRVHEAVIEKDFWVCWVLEYLFLESPWKETLAFKGGTSLSKAYAAIERFSEDIDLILDWRELGYAADEPWDERSATKQDAFGKEANRRTAEFLEQMLAPALTRDLADRLERPLTVQAMGQDILIEYPKAFSLAAIRPVIRLEVGPMAAWVPNHIRAIQPYAAEVLPAPFKNPVVKVRTITAERTFWEKATILHQEAHRGPEKPFPQRYARHYYDLYRLARLPVRANALADPSLLAEVVRFKQRFYRCPWARYERAVPGALRLLPPPHRLDALARDYQEMRPMLFGNIPAFTTILHEISTLEAEINRTKPDTP